MAFQSLSEKVNGIHDQWFYGCQGTVGEEGVQILTDFIAAARVLPFEPNERIDWRPFYRVSELVLAGVFDPDALDRVFFQSLHAYDSRRHPIGPFRQLAEAAWFASSENAMSLRRRLSIGLCSDLSAVIPKAILFLGDEEVANAYASCEFGPHDGLKIRKTLKNENDFLIPLVGLRKCLQDDSCRDGDGLFESFLSVIDMVISYPGHRYYDKGNQLKYVFGIIARADPDIVEPLIEKYLQADFSDSSKDEVTSALESFRFFRNHACGNAPVPVEVVEMDSNSGY